MLAWAWTLIRLYKDIEHSEKLLPNKRIFILHGSLIGGYLVLYALSLIMIYAGKHSENSKTRDILIGSVDLLTGIENLLEIITFFLVIKFMLPITQ